VGLCSEPIKEAFGVKTTQTPKGEIATQISHLNTN
jgi:hypothetical protein